MIKKWLWCSWKHYDHRCYPEVWGRGLMGPWHCEKCHPCGERLDKMRKGYEKKAKQYDNINT